MIQISFRIKSSLPWSGPTILNQTQEERSFLMNFFHAWERKSIMPMKIRVRTHPRMLGNERNEIRWSGNLAGSAPTATSFPSRTDRRSRSLWKYSTMRLCPSPYGRVSSPLSLEKAEFWLSAHKVPEKLCPAFTIGTKSLDPRKRDKAETLGTRKEPRSGRCNWRSVFQVQGG